MINDGSFLPILGTFPKWNKVKEMSSITKLNDWPEATASSTKDHFLPGEDVSEALVHVRS